MTAVQHRRGAAARDRWSWLAWWLPVAAVTGLVAAAVAPDIAVLFGYRSLGPAAAIGQPLARTLAAGAASVAAAGLITAVIHAPGSGQGALSLTGYAAMRVVRPATAVFTVAAATIAVLTVAESIGLSPAALLSAPPIFLLGLVTVEAAAGWALAAVLLALVGVVARTVLTWRGATWLFVLFLAGLVVPPATAVSNSERSHDWYGDAVTVHVVAAALWIGSAVAIWWLARPGPVGEIAWRRHGRLATGAALTLVLSGAVPFALDVGLTGLTSGYGLLVIGSSVMLVAALVAVGLWRGAPVRIRLAIELVLLTAAAAAGAMMTRLVPPQARVPEALDADRLVFLLGYELPDQLGWPELAGVWRIDLLFAPAAAVGLVLYVRTVRRVHRSGGSWPVHRTMLWIAGCVTVLVATSSGIGAYSTAVFGVHLLGHALLSTVAPLLLVGGHPLTLVRAGASTGMVDRVTALTTDGPLQWLRNPAAAWCLAAVASFGVYASGLFEAVVLEHWSHPVMDAVALGTGLLLFRSVLGAREDDQPAFVRLGMLFAVMMLHAGFAIWLLLRAEPVAGPFYAALAMPFVPDLLAAQRQGAVLAWVVSDVAMVAAAAGVVCSWDREGTSPAAAPEVSS
ncbi:cytochrome c oxidase assembly protein [Pseudonocardia sp. ICBG162]|uniref:cytochrome c oxidase assembly protein n=1 Tax=Pseudonocardia sp. ICBG162 TaxID=2846761 RepID=UPI001CF677DD|nr:cytochrome c oxidase assembly protein [Pseudonocardia sp. ICBG162]